MRPAMILACVAALASAAWALEPAEVAVVYNAAFEGSESLARYYLLKRGVPKENLLAVTAPRDEGVSRPVYLETIEAPVRAWLDREGRAGKVKCLLLMRGVPLVVGEIDDVRTREARDRAAGPMQVVDRERLDLEAEKKRLEAEGATAAARLAEVRRRLEDAETRLKPLKAAFDAAVNAWRAVIRDTQASVDSELSVMSAPGHPVQGAMPNALLWSTWNAAGRERLPKTVMTCRLDGPTDAGVRRIIDDSIAAEARGLEGVAYFDAWDRRPEVDPRVPIRAFDERIRQTAAAVEKAGVRTVLENTDKVFQPDTCPNAALYCGWYSLEKYVPAFKWEKGAVGFHVASWEARTLRDPAYQGWCKRMLEEGAAATLGPVWEPYLGSYPDPMAFFAFLLTGRYAMAEVYWYTTPMTSWQLTLVADPLYTPFRRNPKMTIAQMRAAIGMPAPPASK